MKTYLNAKYETAKTIMRNLLERIRVVHPRMTFIGAIMSVLKSIAIGMVIGIGFLHAAFLMMLVVAQRVMDWQPDPISVRLSDALSEYINANMEAGLWVAVAVMGIHIAIPLFRNPYL